MIQRFDITDATVAAAADSIFMLDDATPNPKYAAYNTPPVPLTGQTTRRMALNGGLITLGTIATTGVVTVDVGTCTDAGGSFTPAFSVTLPVQGGIVPLDFSKTGRPDLVFDATQEKLAINLRATTADVAGVRVSGFIDIVPS